ENIRYRGSAVLCCGDTARIWAGASVICYRAICDVEGCRSAIRKIVKRSATGKRIIAAKSAICNRCRSICIESIVDNRAAPIALVAGECAIGCCQRCRTAAGIIRDRAATSAGTDTIVREGGVINRQLTAQIFYSAAEAGWLRAVTQKYATIYTQCAVRKNR